MDGNGDTPDAPNSNKPVNGAVVAQAEEKEEETPPSHTYKMIINDRCPLVRVDASNEVKSIKMKGNKYEFTLEYCYVSQRGYYPNALNKANQDSYVVCERLLGDPYAHVFGVFDGHGEYGDHCSHFAAAQVPVHLEKELKDNFDGINTFKGFKMEEAYNKAFVEANKALHSSPIDDSLSGTTAITGVVVGDILYLANVGDSRAIVAREEEGKIVYSPLSSDQTPYRKDERERIKKKGGRIMTLDQIEGNDTMHENWGTETGDTIDEDGDPPRIWDASLERPGCAFTRSIGDLVAEQVGVCASPEIVTYKLSPRDKFIIIASDGVFEFLTSQAVVDILLRDPDPIKSAKAVVSESYRLWLTYDERTDDITMMVIGLKDFVEQRRQSHTTSSRLRSETSIGLPNTLLSREMKPMRWMMGSGKVKRRTITEKYHVDYLTETFDLEANSTEKSEEDMLLLREMTSACFMFSALSEKHLEMVYKVMRRRSVQAGEMVIREGDPGDEMYVVSTGEFSVFKRDENGITQELLVYNTPGSAFGELSLMYGEPRGASVRANTDGSLWTMGRAAFRSIIMNRRHKGVLSLLRGLPMFRNLPYTSLQRLSESSTEMKLMAEEVIAEEGKEYPWAVCVVLSGDIKLLSKIEHAVDKVIPVGTCFAKSEVGPLWTAAVAVNSCVVLYIPSEEFADIVGVDDSAAQLSTSQVPVRRYSRGGATRNLSMFSTDCIELDRVERRDDYTIDMPLFAVGDYGYIGNFGKKDGNMCAVKIVAKARACQAHMQFSLYTERMVLASLNGQTPFIPKVVASFQDDRITMLVYEDTFVCDLASASTWMDHESKCLASACIYSAICKLHSKGIMHRFINPTSVYISSSGVPKLSDLRYVKPMDGGKTYTICGDPLYFAPELIGQVGYDYGYDLWAFGIVLFELYEERTPFGFDDTEKTELFSAISAFQTDDLVAKFIKTPEDARTLVSSLLVCAPQERLGYKNDSEVREAVYYKDVDWSNLEGAVQSRIVSLPTTFSGDHAIILKEEELDTCVSEAFMKF
eukprot:CAMPEP_0182434428 /NCGR_PEP_ID=MMETSP1167-20130531/69745_1 /TAXON_ID=2988 /ORGANISM="Mallomonas Sp, Strain CCMP3275" /LENGTH=1035 /DNA_ID=CAMNT_0024624297 /DNA_START=148 /DNA_END=3255 /DNA_ORIENTATION=+